MRGVADVYSVLRICYLLYRYIIITYIYQHLLVFYLAIDSIELASDQYIILVLYFHLYFEFQKGQFQVTFLQFIYSLVILQDFSFFVLLLYFKSGEYYTLILTVYNSLLYVIQCAYSLGITNIHRIRKSGVLVDLIREEKLFV